MGERGLDSACLLGKGGFNVILNLINDDIARLLIKLACRLQPQARLDEQARMFIVCEPFGAVAY